MRFTGRAPHRPVCSGCTPSRSTSSPRGISIGETSGAPAHSLPQGPTSLKPASASCSDRAGQQYPRASATRRASEYFNYLHGKRHLSHRACGSAPPDGDARGPAGRPCHPITRRRPTARGPAVRRAQRSGPHGLRAAETPVDPGVSYVPRGKPLIQPTRKRSERVAKP